MRVLVANAGSSSLKLSIVDGDDTVAAQETGAPGTAEADAALRRFAGNAGTVDAVGHRIVHGGPHVQHAVLVDDRVRRALDAGAAIAPLHVPPALHVLDLLRAELPVPHVVCVDTAFHATLPAAAQTYAVPARWRDADGIRRYGFHGLSCAWAVRRASRLLQRDAGDLQLLVAHLGAGASVTAVRGGRSADTSMGFTPLEGLVMATRSGTVDPGALLWLQTARGVPAHELSTVLEREAGLLALAGTADMRAVLDRAAGGDAGAVLARDVFVHRAAACTAGVAASLDRVDALVFTGGIGEHSHAIRSEICSRLTVLGVPATLRDASGAGDVVVSAPGERVVVLVVHAREDLEIVREVRGVLATR